MECRLNFGGMIQMRHHRIRHVIIAVITLIAVSLPFQTSSDISAAANPTITLGVFHSQAGATSLVSKSSVSAPITFTSTDHRLAQQGSQESALLITSPTTQPVRHPFPLITKDTVPMVALVLLVLIFSWTSIGGNEVVALMLKKWHHRRPS